MAKILFAKLVNKDYLYRRKALKVKLLIQNYERISNHSAKAESPERAI